MRCCPGTRHCIGNKKLRCAPTRHEVYPPWPSILSAEQQLNRDKQVTFILWLWYSEIEIDNRNYFEKRKRTRYVCKMLMTNVTSDMQGTYDILHFHDHHINFVLINCELLRLFNLFTGSELCIS